jgi:hypothetical protein
MAGIGIAKKGLGLLKQAFKSRGRKPGVLDKVIGKGVVDRNVKSKEVFKAMKDIKKSKKKYIKRDPHEGVPSQSSDWPYWRGDE